VIGKMHGIQMGCEYCNSPEGIIAKCNGTSRKWHCFALLLTMLSAKPLCEAGTDNWPNPFATGWNCVTIFALSNWGYARVGGGIVGMYGGLL
jgi:hypothetical protein